ncbi:MAG: ATP-binding protein [Acidobacteriota bacterium]
MTPPNLLALNPMPEVTLGPESESSSPGLDQQGSLEEAPPPLDFRGVEWRRWELLASLLGQSRQGKEPSRELLDELGELHRQVDAARAQGLFIQAIADFGLQRPLEAVELDLLSAAAAAEAEPRLGWMFRSLQPGTEDHYPCPALVQELLALDATDAGPLWRALEPGSSLRRGGLVTGGSTPFEALRPAPGIAARLLGREAPLPPPPGATAVDLRPDFDELVLPPDRRRQLDEWLSWVRAGDVVFGSWGARRGGGPVALFSGPSGTGKTFAAAALATRLGWPLFRVDLGRLVSKYIGETEKNLNQLLDSVHGRPAVLQCDEADALFGKRGEVKEARDRYANFEVGHLLARIEVHHGPVILTTNLRQHLDPAFARRFQVVVDFPRPDAEARAELWRRLLPPRAPREPDLDCDELASAVALTGGGIRNAALHAAVLAAAAERPIRREDAVVGIWRELTKVRGEASVSDLGSLAGYLPRGIRG